TAVTFIDSKTEVGTDDTVSDVINALQNYDNKSDGSEAIQTDEEIQPKEELSVEDTTIQPKEEMSVENITIQPKEEMSVENIETQPNEEIPDEQSSNGITLPKYITFSNDDNIDIIVNYMSPVNKDKDNLTFNILIDTHSVDLTNYVDISKYVELRTDAGIVISDGFEWDLENGEGHHISGILRIKNNMEGNSVVDSNTKSFSLVFKNIADTREREHIYEGGNLI
ncbi:MAG TPA: hypothetical protein VEF53_09175, partial [Patescibacteria group bacterium]|nr:hypothetical protein [Patescibacteria group bacterium]